MGMSERISFLALYIRSRQLHYILPACILVITIVTWWSHTIAPDMRNEVDREIVQRNLITSVTVLTAVSFTFTTGSPWGEMDNAAGTVLQRIRLVLFAFITVAAAIMVAGMGLLWESPGAPWMLVRNLLGWIGITLITSKFLGENYARLVSVAWAGIAVSVGDTWRVHYPPWAWSMQDSVDQISWIITLASFILGFVLLGRSTFPTHTE